MSLFDSIAHAFLDGIGDIPLRTRSNPEPLQEQLSAIYRRRAMASPWRAADVSEALGVPAILSAVTLISSTVGTLSLEAFRRGVRLSQEATPRIVQRPNPLTKPYDFFRDTAYYNATRGEFWWWVAQRDIDGSAISLYPVPPWEVKVEANDRNRLKPTIRWGDRIIPNEDMIHHMYLPDHTGLRGVGPLQLAGAAVSVAVESQEWAANYFSGSIPSIVGTTDQDMTPDELKLMDEQWNEKAPNLPRWLTNGLKLSDAPVNPEAAQLTESRQHQVGEAARMYNIPGSLIEYQMGGSSLTYQNQDGIWSDFQRRCLSPHYLEPIEQSISDLLTRSTVARFNLKQLLRASPKDRMEVHKTAIEAGIYGPEVAAQEEGYGPGNVDYAPVPAALPQAIPNLLPVNRPLLALGRAAQEVRCPAGHLLAEAATPPYRFTCFRCKAKVAA